ncbi:lantibiotic dehydratase [Solwaraspora sp. WMMD1047]|uniref:lantibiotic dehydratase n=1 Tax=Solwaraspora sp. WMMD1047 TaxID=3016102 RepID=UPI002416E968|nr:lantibiotic dehydratase [Solwaraspora sp. WMMD1047]MDG4832113.1 lantibiotic dehydratase [Solwaraspora sp. WMMD1047]
MTITAASRRRDHRSRFATPDEFLVRVGGLPLATAERLAFPRTAAWAHRLVDGERALREHAARVGDLLAAAVAAGIAEPAVRAALINVRRDVFNDRAPRDPAAVVTLLAAAAPAALGGYRRWLADRDRLRAVAAGGADLFAAEVADRRAALRAVAEEPALRHGLLLSSRLLDRQLPRYLRADGDARLDKRARRVERSLLEYVYRAATKTSPFSTFTSVCEGGFVDGAATNGSGGPVLRLDRAGGGQRHHVRLNVAALTGLAGAVIARDDIRAGLPVRLVTGLRSGAHRLSYLRRQAGRGGGGVVQRLQENLFHLPTSDLMHDLIELLGQGRTRPLRAVADVLVARDPGGRNPADVNRYLDHLLRLGLLVAPALRVDIHHPDPLAGFRAGLRDLDQPWADPLLARLDTVDRHLAGYPDADLAGRRDLLDAIGDELVRARLDLGQSAADPPDNPVYEDVVLPARVTADRAAWGRLTAGLAAVAGILPVFDIQIARRLVTKGYFRARYGAGGRADDVLTFAHEYLDDFFDHFAGSQLRRRPFDAENRYVPQSNTFRLAEIDLLDEARELAGQRVNAAYAALPPGATELVLDDGFFTALRDRVPATLGPVEAHGFFLQVARTPAGPLAVVNKGFTGPALMVSRFAHWLGGPGDGRPDLLSRGLAAACPPGVVFAELKGGHEDTNLNLHPAATDYELVCPGDISSRPAEEQIPIDDLVLFDDPVADRLVLRSRRLGVEVVPVYLGFLLPMALPEIQQVLLTFSPTGMAALDLWAGTTVPLPDRGIAGYPRIRYRDVVLQRRMWKAHPDCLPAVAADAPGSDWLLAWARWRREHGLPRRVFVTPDGAGRAGARAFGSHKPLYVDFDSYFSLTLLAAVAREADKRLVFTEMLPDHGQQWLTDGGAAHVSELVLAFNAAQEEVPR